MEVNSKNIQLKILSALNSTLKVLLWIWRKIKYYSGLLLIDKLLRSIVLWYDKRHVNITSGKRHQDNSEVKRIYSILEHKEYECNDLKNRLDSIQQDYSSLMQRTEILNNSLKESNEHTARLQHDLLQKEAEIEAINKEKEVIKKRCLPENDIPEMIYFAQGDTTGEWFRRISTKRSSEHLFELRTYQGDTSVCSFKPIANTNISYIIYNRNITLLPCEILDISPSASSIETVEKGRARLENNRWKIVKKAKIKLI